MLQPSMPFYLSVEGQGHLHVYISPQIQVEFDNETGEVSGVSFTQFTNRSDFLWGFCVFSNVDPDLSTNEFQILNVNFSLQALQQTI